MKMTLRTAELARALYRVQGVADKKSTMPSLAHVLLNATSDGLAVSATDMDVGLCGTYEATVQTPGAVAVHARQLYEIVKSLSAETVELEKRDNNWVDLHSGPSRFRLVGMAAEEFPALPNHAQTKSFKLPAQDLIRLIDRTIFCVSTDDNRHNLSGVYCESPKPNLLRMVSTDGHRLALAEQHFDSDISIEHGVIVPRKGFQELKRVLSDAAENIETVELGFSSSSGVLRAGSVTLSTRLVEGQFPDYTQVIPKTGDKVAKISRTTLADALRRVSLLSQGRSYGVRLIFEEGKLNLVAEDPEFGEAHEELEISYKGPKLTIGFNARYILDVLALITDEGVMFELTDDLSPGVLKPLEQPGFLAVVMPMRI
jgi:DNA polymerase III subunit beta